MLNIGWDFDYEKRISELKIAKYLGETVQKAVKQIKECITHDKIVNVVAKTAQKVLSDDELKKFKYETHRLNYKIVESLNTTAKEVLSAVEFEKFDYVTRSPQDRIADFLDETAKDVLSPDELKEYEDYSDYIASVDPGTKYRTIENIEATFDNGLYQANETLMDILKSNGFEVFDGQKFAASIYFSFCP